MPLFGSGTRGGSSEIYSVYGVYGRLSDKGGSWIDNLRKVKSALDRHLENPKNRESGRDLVDMSSLIGSMIDDIRDVRSDESRGIERLRIISEDVRSFMGKKAGT